MSVTDEHSLKTLAQKFKTKGWIYTEFLEPDVDNQLTAVCVYGTPEVRKSLSSLPLTLKTHKNNETV